MSTNITNTTAITSNSTLAEVSDHITTNIIPDIFSSYTDFFTTPFTHPEMWWLLIHLLTTFVLFEFYFERHRDEDLGWTAALANSIVFFFVSIELLRLIYGHEYSPFNVFIDILRDYVSLGLFSEQMMLVSLILLLCGLAILSAVMNYYHYLPKKLAYMISGHKTLNLFGYFLMVVVYQSVNTAEIELSWTVFAALFLFGLTMWVFLNMLVLYRRKKKSRDIFS